MNIFILDKDIKKSAQYHCDKHCIKMILEYAQLLSTAVRELTGLDVGYKATHKNHPCAVWVRKSLGNWLYVKELACHLNDEYMFRYNKQVNHKSWDLIETLPVPEYENVNLTEFPICMPDDCNNGDAIESYRDYYKVHKKKLLSWKKRGSPEWI